MNLDAVIREIDQADSVETEVLMEVIFERKRQLYPDWDICYLALPKEDWEKRKKILHGILRLEEKINGIRVNE